MHTSERDDMGQPDQPDNLRAVRSIQAAREQTLAERYGGFYWGSDFIGFAVAVFFTLVFLGIVGAVIGGAGYQLGTPLPKLDGSVSGIQQNLAIGTLVGSLIALLLAYVIGGYTAGRMARFDGVKNGIGVVIWTVIVAIILAVAGAVLGTKFNVASQIHLSIGKSTLTTAGIISAVVVLVVMLIGAALGGWMGARYHRHIDRTAATVS